VAESRAVRGLAVLPERVRPLLAERLRGIRPPRWWQEIGFIAIVYYLYSLVRNAVPSHETGAFDRARTVLSIESWFHLDVEHSVNRFVAGQHWLAYICNYYYSTLHFVVTIAVLVWLYRRHPLHYRAIRSVLIITNLVALIGFWFISVAPPRMLPGYVDTVVKFHTWGSLASPGLAKESNQFAAMPSLHIGWSLWCAFAIVTLAKHRWVRVLGALYPIATTFVILGTANHYVVDAVAGAVTLLLAVGIQRLLAGRPIYVREAFGAPALAPNRELVTV
jgi:PAP2 superfamily